MADPKSRARVERLLGGNFRPDDLTGLFLFARDHCDGREAVAEIGHFVAHHNERDKGIVTRATRDWFTVVRFYMSRFGQSAEALPVYGDKMPSSTRDYFRIAVNRIDAKYIREKTGMRRADAHRLLNDVTERLVQNADGTWALPDNLMPQEVSLVECVIGVLVTKPAFDAERLCDDFLATLKSNGLITKEELSEHKSSLQTLVQLFAVATMHNCIVQIGDGTVAQLRGRTAPTIGRIMIYANVPGAVPYAPQVAFGASMFTANLDPNIHCHPDLLTDKEWDCEVEVAPDRRLSPLR